MQLTIPTINGHDTHNYDPKNKEELDKVTSLVLDELAKGNSLLYVIDKKKEMKKVGGKELTIGSVKDNLEKLTRVLIDTNNIVVGLKPVVSGG